MFQTGNQTIFDTSVNFELHTLQNCILKQYLLKVFVHHFFSIIEESPYKRIAKRTQKFARYKTRDSKKIGRMSSQIFPPTCNLNNIIFAELSRDSDAPLVLFNLILRIGPKVEIRNVSQLHIWRKSVELCACAWIWPSRLSLSSRGNDPIPRIKSISQLFVLLGKEKKDLKELITKKSRGLSGWSEHSL